ARRQPVARLVEGGHGALVVVDGNDRQDRAEDLLLADAIHWPDAGEDRRLEEEAVLEPRCGRPPAARDQLALALTDPYVVLDLCPARVVDERSDVGRRLQSIAQSELAGSALESLEERLDHGSLDDHPAAGRATLTRRPEGRPDDPIGRQVEVGVGKDDDPVLAAELEADPLEATSGPLGDAPPGRGITGEREDRHVRRLDDRVT